MRRRLAVICLLGLGLAAGCGQTGDATGDFEGAEREVATVVEDLQEAATDGEERRICRQLLSAELARAAGDCNRAVQTALDETDSNDLTVVDVRVMGDRARARVETGTREQQTEVFELVRENRSWRLSSLGS